MSKGRLLINPVVRWAVEPMYARTLAQIDGVAGVQRRIPEVDEVLTLPFIVDATTQLPCPMRVVRVEYMETAQGTVVIPVLIPARPG